MASERVARLASDAASPTIREAAARAAGRLTELAARRAGSAAAEILEAQALMLSDPALETTIGTLLDSGVPADRAVVEATERYAAELERLGDPYLRQRAADVREVGRLLLAELRGAGSSRLEGLERPSVVFADDLSPADILGAPPGLILALATETGGPTSHTAIVARELGLPAVVGVEGLLARADAVAAEVDGGSGTVRLLSAEVAAGQRKRAVLRLPLERAPVRLMANVGSARAAELAAARGARGIGLFRTELLFLDQAGPPDEDRQAQEYAAACRALTPEPVIVRTLDVGSDKALPYLATEPEPNPALGRRGVRLWLTHEELWRPQVRALVRVAADHPNLKVMLPMVAAREEVMEASRLFAAEARRRHVQPPPLGIMVELPATAADLEPFADLIRFISLGTNDLTQYALGADRQLRWKPQLGELNPGVLRLIANCLQQAARLGLEAGVCGEMAGTVEGAVFLVGAGANSLSMGADSLGKVLAVLQRLGPTGCRQAASAALETADAAAARRALRLRSRTAPAP